MDVATDERMERTAAPAAKRGGTRSAKSAAISAAATWAATFAVMERAPLTTPCAIA
jgi:hypothetical protein